MKPTRWVELPDFFQIKLQNAIISRGNYGLKPHAESAQPPEPPSCVTYLIGRKGYDLSFLELAGM